MRIENLSEGVDEFTGNVWKLENSETVLVDAGTGNEVWGKIQQLDDIDKVVVTHSHYDHVDNLPKILDMFDPGIYALEPANLPVEAQELEEDGTLEMCGEEFQVIYTPGHRRDSICLYSEESGKLFAGDLLFPEGGFGRTDLPDGDRDVLIESIEKIVELDVKEMYCGHDPAALQNVNSQIEDSLEKAKQHEPKYS
jgi:glyoxylase-like metal-dependent hydrolase (beta-lactamase superfamily II)